MDTVELRVARTIGELSGLPLGTRIATNHNKLLVLDVFAGAPFWFEEGELTPYLPLVRWLPAYVLPTAVDHLRDVARKVVCEVLVEEDDEPAAQ